MNEEIKTLKMARRHGLQQILSANMKSVKGISFRI